MPADAAAELVAYPLQAILESLRDKDKWFWSIIILIAIFVGLILYLT